MSAADDNAPQPLIPNREDISAHLWAVFGPRWIRGYTDGLIEIAWTNRATGALSNARMFPVAGDFDEIVDFVVETNKVEGQNCYYGATLRSPDTAPFGRGDDNDAYAATVVWGDCDNDAALLGVKDTSDRVGLRINFAVFTGTVPERRGQVYFALTEPLADMEELKRRNKGLIAAFPGSDPAVFNPGRVLRIGGTISYPNEKKRERGYVTELTVFRAVSEERVPIERIARLFPTPVDTAAASAADDKLGLGMKAGRTDSEIMALLEATRVKGQWRDNMLKATASMVGKGWPDSVIRMVCGPYCDDGPEDKDLGPLILTAREKWSKPDAGDDWSVGPDGKIHADSEKPDPGEQPDRSDLLVAAWIQREIPEREYLLGTLLCTTSRYMLYGETGVGKTLFALDLGGAVAAGQPFLHWAGSGEPRRVMYLDGELPAETAKERIEEMSKRYGTEIQLWFYGRDVLAEHDMPPINTPIGEAWLLREIDAIKPDLIIFDSIMCLLAGDMKDEEQWQPIKGLMRKLTHQRVAQIWMHHTGHDATKSYGTKTREWELDTVIALTKTGSEDAFQLEFTKARLRTPKNAAEFVPIVLRLTERGWEGSAGTAGQRKSHTMSPRDAMAQDIRQSWERIVFDYGEDLLGMDAAIVRKVKTANILKELAQRGQVDCDERNQPTPNGRRLFYRVIGDLVRDGFWIVSQPYAWRIAK